VVRLERTKIGKEPLSIFKIFHSSFNFNKCEQKRSPLEKGMEVAMFLPIAAGKFSLLSYWLVAGIWEFPSGFPIPF
jgi:hypothetical protein